jgi:hypothetical protein
MPATDPALMSRLHSAARDSYRFECPGYAWVVPIMKDLSSDDADRARKTGIAEVMLTR